MSQGATPELVEKLDDFEASDLPERTKAALRLADKLWSDDKTLTPEFYAELRTEFSDDQILDLGMCISFMSSWQQFIEAFGIVPDSWQKLAEGGAPDFGPDFVPPTQSHRAWAFSLHLTWVLFDGSLRLHDASGRHKHRGQPARGHQRPH